MTNERCYQGDETFPWDRVRWRPVTTANTSIKHCTSTTMEAFIECAETGRCVPIIVTGMTQTFCDKLRASGIQAFEQYQRDQQRHQPVCCKFPEK